MVQGLAGLQMVKTLVTEPVKSAMSSVTTELLEAVDKRITVHTATVAISAVSRPHGELGSGLACLTCGGNRHLRLA